MATSYAKYPTVFKDYQENLNDFNRLKLQLQNVSNMMSRDS